MSSRDTDAQLVAHERNLARYFTETRHVSWVLLVATLAWGAFAYAKMPKAKDPLVPVRIAVALCNWPGASAEKVEQLVTRKVEERIAESSKVEKIESISRSGVSVVYVTLSETVLDRAKEFDDIQGKLETIRDFPSGAGPVNFIKDFGETAALMLSVASPKVSEIELDLRAKALERAIALARRGEAGRATLVVSFPGAMNNALLRAAGAGAVHWFEDLGDRDGRLIEGPGFLGVDLKPEHDDAKLLSELQEYGAAKLRLSELHPDVWQATVIRDPRQTRDRLAAVAADRYTYRELDEYTDTIKRYLQTIPLVSKVTRSGVLPEAVYLDYSQEKLAGYGLQQASLEQLLGSRNINAPGGVLDIQGKNVAIDPSGELKNEGELGDMLVPPPAGGSPLHLRDLVDVSREYQSPARYLNYLTARDAQGKFLRTRAITLAVQMRPGSQIEEFGELIDQKLAEVKTLLPEDLVMRRTSDQPLQVRENVALFMNSLYEAIALVVLVALIGFWEWRSALIMALAIPLTLAMTFGFMLALGIDIQQISIASLILALGLLVDDPVVAGDAIKRSLKAGFPPLIAAWLGPTKLATAILFATITNIVAYLPFLVLKGDVGQFIYSLPVVLTCSLVASRIVSMTFIPLLGYLILRSPAPQQLAPRPNPFVRGYRTLVGFCIDHRFVVFAASLGLLVLAFSAARGLRVAFFPQDLSYLSYVDVWLPEDATLAATRDKARDADLIIREVAEEYGKRGSAHAGQNSVLESLTTFVGGGGPRFWFSVSPELQQLNYAQLVIQVKDKHDTAALVPLLQRALSSRIAGARLDVRQLETGKPVGVPVAVRIVGEDQAELRRQAERVKALFRSLPSTDRIRDDWGSDSFKVMLQVDPDRANLAGVTNLDVAQSSAVAMSGRMLSLLREGNRQIPIVARLRSSERAQLSDIQNLYVSSQRDGVPRVPLRQVSQFAYSLDTAKIRRRDQFRAITVACFPVAGVLASEVLAPVQKRIEQLAQTLPPGYRLTVAGEQEERKKGFGQLMVVLAVSICAIFLALVVQFKSAIKPAIVFAAIPYGVAAALVSLEVMGAPFGFMAFLGIISLIGVIVSHIIVLFDFIEERHAEGAALREALLDAGIVRLRPVLITVGATVLGLLPLAAHGGPLWEPLCYAQIGGLTCATLLTLLLVPVLYTIVVRDLGWVRWDEPSTQAVLPPTTGPGLPLTAAGDTAE